MRGFSYLLIATLFVSLMIIACGSGGPARSQESGNEVVVELPDPDLDSSISLADCLLNRSSKRDYSDRPLTLDEISGILWAAQGITRDWGARTTPSAGGLFPIRLYVVSGNVEGLESGSWLYSPEEHSLTLVTEGELLDDLQDAAVDQQCVGSASCVIVISAIYEVTSWKYGERSTRYIDAEAGAVCQNIYLMCESLGLGTVCIGAFYDDTIASIIGTDNMIRLIMPVGAPEE